MESLAKGSFISFLVLVIATASSWGVSAGREMRLNVIYMAQAGYQPEQFEEMTREFTEETGIDVAVNIVRYDEEYQKIVTSATSPVATYDVVLLDLIWVAEFAEKSYVVPLDKGLASRAREDVSPIILSAFEHRGRIWAMPFLANLHFLFYNSDMLQRAGFKAPPATVEEMETQMREIKRRGIVDYPMIASWNQKEGLVCEYVWLVGAYGGEIFDVRNEPVFNRGPGVLALDTMVRWVREGLVDPLALTADELVAKDVFMAGKAAFVPNWTFLCGLMNDPAVSRIAGQAKMALLPVAKAVRDGSGRLSSSVSGFQGLAVMANSSRKEDAWKYVEFMTSPAFQGRFLEEVPVWTSLQMSPAARAKDPLLDLKLEQMRWLHHRPKLVRYQEISAIMQRFIHAALEGAMSPKDALDEAAERIRRLP
ncbi:MAG: extracellular solute-binding protein [Firmicutes bacterium]|nr:extracellular solute-binding protein [Bacillota bacterium]MDH7495573.1 extracellular solute-binding protein [Bacillota bacterium]